MPPAALTFVSHIFQTTSCFLASSASGPVSASGAPILITSAARAGGAEIAAMPAARIIAPENPAVVRRMMTSGPDDDVGGSGGQSPCRDHPATATFPATGVSVGMVAQAAAARLPNVWAGDYRI